MLLKNSENTTLNFELFPVSGKPVELSFTGEQISSDGGLLLLREVENKIGFMDRISSCITDSRDQRYIDHSITEKPSNQTAYMAPLSALLGL